MELNKSFNHKEAEENWYNHWMSSGYFTSKPDEREPYTIVMPPPNVTGILHMGHCLNNTIQDILIRRARMNGLNACWVPGTDHASIATEAKVVQMLREKGIQKGSLSRDEFLKYAWEWKEKYGGIILQQLKKLGCSLDWDRTTFTMDPDYYRSVTGVFTDLYRKGYIYRGKRMINWDVKAKTALSDEEVIRKETKQQLCFLKYQLEGSDEYIQVATVRPETIMGDTAVCVNPKDERYLHLHGKKVIVPLINRVVPIIADDYVLMDFGTGALKVTPAHDVNDYQLGIKHKLDVIDVLNEDGTLNENAQIYVGEDRFVARKKIIQELLEKGLLLKTEEYTSEVGHSERTDSVVEPRLSLQWWVDMKKLATPALEVVLNEEIDFYPGKFKNLYRHWMENIKDWCISRQLWWGQRIPAWYDRDGNIYVAPTIEELHKEYPETIGLDLRQDEDCLDTWFSSWLWPFEVFKGYSEPNNNEIAYYYPTNTLVTAPEIIFFWVARMIMAGIEFKKAIPFREVYFTGIVRDKQGRKMSKSLGNSPDLLELIDRYGADACRFGIMISSPAGNDLLWDESSNEQGRNFCNKIWNALKLLRLWETNGFKEEQQDGSDGEKSFASSWFENRLSEATIQINQLFEDYRLSEALKTVYSLIWDDYCSWYLEWIKPNYGDKISRSEYEKAVEFAEELMHLLHPFMPFITEEVYHLLKARETGNDLIVRQSAIRQTSEKQILAKAILLKEVITSIREARAQNQMKPKDPIVLYIESKEPGGYSGITEILKKQVNANELFFGASEEKGKISVVIGPDKFYIIGQINTDSGAQKEVILKDIAYYEGFLVSVEKKLGNERFLQNAKPDVIEHERKKQADAASKLKSLRETLEAL